MQNLGRPDKIEKNKHLQSPGDAGLQWCLRILLARSAVTREALTRPTGSKLTKRSTIRRWILTIIGSRWENDTRIPRPAKIGLRSFDAGGVFVPSQGNARKLAGIGFCPSGDVFLSRWGLFFSKRDVFLLTKGKNSIE